MFGHSLAVVGGVGGDRGGRGDEKTDLNCETLVRMDEVGEGALAGVGDGVRSSGTE